MDTYAVVLKGIASNTDGFRTGLLKLGMKPGVVEQVIQSIPCVLKQRLTLEQARVYEEAFRNAGGLVAVEREARSTAPPAVELPPPRPVVASAAVASKPVPVAGAPAASSAPAAPESPFGALEAAVPLGAVLPGLAAPTATAAAVGGTPATPSSPLLDLGAEDDAAAPLDLAAAPAPAKPATARPIELPPPTALPPKSFTAPPTVDVVADPRKRKVLQAVGAVLAFGVLYGGCSLLSKYQIYDKQHSFSRLAKVELKGQIDKLRRSQGAATPDDVETIVRGFAKRAGIDLLDLELMAYPIEVPPRPDGMGGMGMGGPCPMLFAELPQLPMEAQMEFRDMMLHCELAHWAVGFRARIKGRYLFFSDERDVEHWAFVVAYAPDGEVGGGDDDDE